MKLLKIIILLVFFISVVPLGAFCKDTRNVKQQGHCVLMCHTICSHAIVSGKSIFVPSPAGFSIAASTIQLSYQNPFLDTFKRPPVVSA
jgi:hypothetical protein